MKSFRDQLKECRENDTAQINKLYYPLLYCSKYKTRCESGVCKKDREVENGKRSIKE